MKRAQHASHNPKVGIIQTSSVVAIKRLNGPPIHMVESDHRLRKRPQPPPDFATVGELRSTLSTIRSVPRRFPDVR